MFIGEATPENLAKVLGSIAVEGNKAMGVSLRDFTLKAETHVKSVLTLTTHSVGTPTASSPGSPPSLVTGTLRRSITHTPVVPLGILGFETKLGTGAGFYPPKRGRSRSATPSSKYGMYLELGMLRNGASYPFLKTGVNEAVAIFRPVFMTAFKTVKWV